MGRDLRDDYYEEPLARDIPSYLCCSIFSTLINPIFGIAAIVFSAFSMKKRSAGSVVGARFYSDLAFGFAFFGVIASVLIVVLVYAFGKFPDDDYYDRNKLIEDAG